jgi:hypothetical protein
VSESRDEQQDEKGKHWRHGLPLQRMGKMTSPGKRPLLYPERGFKPLRCIENNRVYN